MSTGLAPEVTEFLSRLDEAVRDGSFTRLTLGKPRGGDDATLQNVYVRPVRLKAGPHLSFLWRHDTRDLTKNVTPEDGVLEVGRLVGAIFHSAHLFLANRTVQLEFNKKGEPRLTSGKPARSTAGPASVAHDRAKPRLLPDCSQEWLHALGITNSAGVVREGLADKHRQIHKFVELLSHLVAAAPIAEAASPGLPHDRPIELADMGCGKGYLTFAAHDYFEFTARRSVRVCGVEQRPELVEQCNRLAHDTGREKLSFVRGTIQDATIPPPDILIALHACDTATDDAIARGLAAGTTLIVTAPCCQKQVRTQLIPAAGSPLAPALRHGIFAERHAEFATDALRALLLEWAGYEAKVFEFISTEHTAKNLMIAATRRAQPDDERTRDRRARAVRELAAFYGVQHHALAAHLDFPLA
jgi:hypothetical protein